MGLASHVCWYKITSTPTPLCTLFCACRFNIQNVQAKNRLHVEKDINVSQWVSEIWTSMDFRHSMTVWFPNPKFGFETLFYKMCLKSKLSRSDSRKFCETSEIEPNVGFQTHRRVWNPDFRHLLYLSKLTCKLMRLRIVNRIVVVESNLDSKFDRRFGFQRFHWVGDHDFDLKLNYFW